MAPRRLPASILAALGLTAIGCKPSDTGDTPGDTGIGACLDFPVDSATLGPCLDFDTDSAIEGTDGDCDSDTDTDVDSDSDGTEADTDGTDTDVGGTDADTASTDTFSPCLDFDTDTVFGGTDVDCDSDSHEPADLRRAQTSPADRVLNRGILPDDVAQLLRERRKNQ